MPFTLGTIVCRFRAQAPLVRCIPWFDSTCARARARAVLHLAAPCLAGQMTPPPCLQAGPLNHSLMAGSIRPAKASAAREAARTTAMGTVGAGNITTVTSRRWVEAGDWDTETTGGMLQGAAGTGALPWALPMEEEARTAMAEAITTTARQTGRDLMAAAGSEGGAAAAMVVLAEDMTQCTVQLPAGATTIMCTLDAEAAARKVIFGAAGITSGAAAPLGATDDRRGEGGKGGKGGMRAHGPVPGSTGRGRAVARGEEECSTTAPGVTDSNHTPARPMKGEMVVVGGHMAAAVVHAVRATCREAGTEILGALARGGTTTIGRIKTS